MSTKKTKATTASLNPRQAEVIKKIVEEGKSQTAAYAEVYPVKNSEVATAGASRMLANVNVQNALQEALRDQGIDEQSIAETLITIRKNRDWRAKEAFVKHAGKFLGYDTSSQAGPVAQVGNIVNNWVSEK